MISSKGRVFYKFYVLQCFKNSEWIKEWVDEQTQPKGPMMKRWDIKEGHTLFLHIVWTILLSYFVAGLLGADNNRPTEGKTLCSQKGRCTLVGWETFQAADFLHHENLPERGQRDKVSSMRMEGNCVGENRAQRFFGRKITALWAGKFFHLRVICSGMCKGK